MLCNLAGLLSSAFIATERVNEEAWNATLATVDHRLKHVKPEHQDRCRSVLTASKQPGFSQFWQDWLLYRNFFAGQERGLYVDIGTNEAVTISNTVFFDVCMGWDGVCFEPQKQYHAAIRARRSCQLVPHCVLGRAASVVAKGKDGTLTLREGAADNAATGAKPKASMQCVGLLDEIRRLGLGTRTVDFLSIDIEGLESSVLRCLPWSEMDIRVVLIETNQVGLRANGTNYGMQAVNSFFSNHGYANVATIIDSSRHRSKKKRAPIDNIFVKMNGGPLVFPPPGVECNSAQLRRQNPWCNEARRWIWQGDEAKTMSATSGFSSCDMTRRTGHGLPPPDRSVSGARDGTTSSRPHPVHRSPSRGPWTAHATGRSGAWRRWLPGALRWR